MMAMPGLDADKSLLWQEELTEIILPYYILNYKFFTISIFLHPFKNKIY